MEKSLKILKIEFDSEPGYGDSDKYIKTKIKIYAGVMITNFRSKKKAKRKSMMQVYINNDTRFCYQGKEKVLSSNNFGRMQI